MKTVNELMFYCLLFGDNQPTLHTLLVLSARARSAVLIFPQHQPLRPSLTKFMLNFILVEDHQASSLADFHAGASASSCSSPYCPPVVVCSERPISASLLLVAHQNGAKHARQIVQIGPVQANARKMRTTVRLMRGIGAIMVVFIEPGCEVCWRLS